MRIDPGLLHGFDHKHKSATSYLDLAANANGAEKGHLVHRAVTRTDKPQPHVVEIGPGGGSAVSYLAQQLATALDQQPSRQVRLTLVEAPGIVSESLTQAIEEFGQVGQAYLVHGFAQDLTTLLDRPADVISASALLHEVYSYGGGYPGLYRILRDLPSCLAPNGHFAYRDVYAVKRASLHERAVSSYDAPSWLRFVSMFTPGYLREGTHPYHRHDDEVLARQRGVIVPIADLDLTTCVFLSAPIGLFREIQRHYLTFRDHVWRSGALGFVPFLEGPLSGDWIDLRAGHKRVHYQLAAADFLTRSQKEMLRVVSEPYGDHLVVDGDLFDEVTDIALTRFLAEAVTDSGGACAQVWEAWMTREGRETYAYMTIDHLLTAVATHSAEAGDTVLMPVSSDDVIRAQRAYYNRHLTRSLATPLLDAKQLVLFQNIPLSDTQTLRRGLHTLHRFCAKDSLARVYTALNARG